MCVFDCSVFKLSCKIVDLFYKQEKTHFKNKKIIISKIKSIKINHLELKKKMEIKKLQPKIHDLYNIS